MHFQYPEPLKYALFRTFANFSRRGSSRSTLELSKPSKIRYFFLVASIRRCVALHKIARPQECTCTAFSLKIKLLPQIRSPMSPALTNRPNIGKNRTCNVNQSQCKVPPGGLAPRRRSDQNCTMPTHWRPHPSVSWYFKICEENPPIPRRFDARFEFSTSRRGHM